MAKSVGILPLPGPLSPQYGKEHRNTSKAPTPKADPGPPFRPPGSTPGRAGFPGAARACLIRRNSSMLAYGSYLHSHHFTS
eukprot:273632-Prorocentrum_minimum.AAC.1